MFVLGVDPGLTTTGYGVVEAAPGGPRAVAVGVIRTDPAAEVAQRLQELRRDLAGVIADHSPQVVAMEQVFTNLNLRTAVSVGRASGVVMLTAAEAGLRVVEYTPTQVKAAIAGYGAAGKRQVAQMVARRLRLATLPAPADAADALAVALCHLQASPLREVGA